MNTPTASTRTKRHKAVWGPKRILTLLAVLTLAAPLTAAAAGTQRIARKGRPSLPNTFSRDYKVDKRVLDRRSKGRLEGNMTAGQPQERDPLLHLLGVKKAARV